MHVRIANATFNSEQSRIALSGDVVNMKAPIVSGHLTAGLSLPEIERSVDLPIHSQTAGTPRKLTVDVAASLMQSTKMIQSGTMQISLSGERTFEASGKLDPSRRENIQFRANFALPELVRLLRLSGVGLQGDLQANGRATLDEKKTYAVDGILESRNLAVRSSEVKWQDVSLASPVPCGPIPD